MAFVVPVFFDFVCPWSYSARPREKRLARELKVSFAYLPWELSPEAPAQPRENPHPRVGERLRAYAAASGVEIRPPPRTPNTRRALRGVLVAKAQGALDAYLDRAFEAYWEEHRDLHDEETLRLVARESGLDEDAFLHDVLDATWDPMLHAVDALGEAHGVETTVTYLMPDGERVQAMGAPRELERKLREEMDERDAPSLRVRRA